MLFSGYICKYRFEKCNSLHKEATNQSLNQKSRCFYIGAFCFQATHRFQEYSGNYLLQLLHTPLTSISTCSLRYPRGSFISGTATSSRQTVLPQLLQMKCT